MYFFSPPAILKWITPSYVYWNVENAQRKIYLTLDDGPDERVTTEVLSILKDFGARATFFCLGKNAEKHPAILENILLQGHALGNHTYSHCNAWRTSKSGFMKDVKKCDEVFRSSLMRPPYGNLPLYGLNELNKQYKIIMWSLMSFDFDKRIASDAIVSHFAANTRSGSVWVFHDNMKARERCLSALPLLIDHFMKKGFVFEKLDARKL